MKHTLYILIFLLTANLTAQQLPKVSIIADTTNIRIGEQIKLTLQAETDSLSVVSFPEPAEFGELEVVESSKVDTLSKKPFRFVKKDYYITQWDSGNYVLPQIELRINDSILKTDSLMIAVKSVAVDTTKQMLYDYKGIVNAEGDNAANLKASSSKWWWLLSLLLLIPLFFFLRKKRKEYIERKKPLTPYEQATLALQKLKDNKQWLNDKVDEYYLGLTDTLKEYLEGELNLSAKEKISSQLLQDLQQYRFENGKYFNQDLLQRLQAMFQRADLAKFAKLQPDPVNVENDFSIINDTIELAHKIIKEIEDEKAEEIAERLAAKKRKKRIVYIVSASIITLVLLIGGLSYYYLKKNGLIEHINENVSAPEWVYSEYGGSPSLGLTTPHILNAMDVDMMLGDNKEEIMKSVEEMSVYVDQNFVKSYAIMEGNMDLKDAKTYEAIKQSIGKVFLEGGFKQMKAVNVKINEEEIENGIRYYGSFDMKVPVLKSIKHFAFESKFFNKNALRFVMGYYVEGNKDAKNIVERVISSAELLN